jgi:hypothetical protein|tara:strand:+ start:209 stop:610 length:402 start_codon:yes stop_codon:yes gene_type:complete
MDNNKKLNMSDSIKKYQETKINKSISAKEVLKKEYPIIYQTYVEVMDEQFELFAKKHLDYGMGNVSAGTQLVNDEETEFAMTGLWYRLSDKINRWKNMILTGRKAQNETLVDTFQDITNYGIICQMVFKNKWK